MAFEFERKPKEFHGYSGTPTYRVWNAMRQRCHDDKHPAYSRYGGRGITVCDRWIDSVAAFVEDMGERPKGMTLDRIDNDLGYYPENCRWATPRQQSRNRRKNLLVTVGGKRRMAIDVAAENGISAGLLYSRISNGWTIEQSAGIAERHAYGAITIDGETRTMSEWARKLDISPQAVDHRIKSGWSIRDALTKPKTNMLDTKGVPSGPVAKRRNTIIGNLITKGRVRLGMIQTELAATIGISHKTMLNIETKKARVSLDIAILLFRTLHLTIDDAKEARNVTWQ